MLGRIALAALTLLTGCRSAKPPEPTAPGTSAPLSYPAVLIGQGSLSVRDDEKSLISASLASGLNFFERKILDSTGSIYEIKNAVKISGDGWWRDMGSSQQVYFLELEKATSSLEDARRVVLKELDSPQGSWQGNPKAVARVKAFTTVAELIEGCRTSWDWSN